MFARKLISSALGIWMSAAGGMAFAQEGAPAPTSAAREAQVSPNQQTADAIVHALRHSGRLRGYRIDVAFAGGVAELTGQVTDAAQRQEAIQIAKGVNGVRSVRDQLMALDGSVQTTQATIPGFAQQNPGLDRGFQAPMPGKMPQDPVSILPVMPGPNHGMQPPPLPPYAWPTYAPYNNYSRVATPNLYPYEAWPFIGPMYPFPKIPLGWRSVSLTWQDGYWWYGREASGHDWWRIRYW